MLKAFWFFLRENSTFVFPPSTPFMNWENLGEKYNYYFFLNTVS